MRYSMKKDPTGKKPDFHYYSVAAAALWLAAKVEENCRKMKELVVACVRIAQKKPDKIVDEQDKEFWRWRDTILALEDRLLEGLCFDLSLEPPYQFLYDFMTMLQIAENKSFRNAAWAFINDSVMTPICLLHPPRVIAAAAIYAAARSRDVQFQVPEQEDGKPWWTSLGVEVRDIKKACNYMAGVYENAPLRSGAAEGMYLRTPEDEEHTAEAEPSQTQVRSTREASTVSAAGSDVSRKRARDDYDHNNQQPASVNDVPWGGQDERTAKRNKTEAAVERALKSGNIVKAEELEAAQGDKNGTNGAPMNGNGISLAGVPPEAGPEIHDKSSEPKQKYTGPVSPDLGGSEEGELDE